MSSTNNQEGTVSFGPFRLSPQARLLEREGTPLSIGGRALDILVCLVEHAGEVVSKKDLMAWVWDDVTVDEGSLRFHLTALRKALGDGRSGARYIVNAPGRGYSFVAPISRSTERRAPAATMAASFSHANLPARLIGMIGRDDDLQRLSSRLNAARFVTIVGSGGIGKTTLAVALGHHLMDAFAGAVLFVDLGTVSSPDLVPTVVASMLGLSVQSDDATPSLIAHLRDKRILLILDTCEHLVEVVAALASAIFAAAPQVHILTTSRETLQIEGEHVHRLGSLECPPDEVMLTATDARSYPAIQLFVERALASGGELDFSDAETAAVVDICRKLDGVALAIELAARRVESYGVHQIAAVLHQRLALLWAGPRGAPPRQKTLQATLDWSYGLLSKTERTVLRRLAVFVGYFTLHAALAVVTSTIVDQELVFGAIDSLVAKSMVATRVIGGTMRYRLLDTTRAYALESSSDEAELGDLALRHATYFQRWLEQAVTEWPTLSTGEQRAPHFAAINNVRAALEWCFGKNGNAEVGIQLAAAAMPVFLEMSLLTECHRWASRAILALDDASRGGKVEMRLQAALGVSLMFTRGGMDAARVALVRSCAIAEARADAFDQLRALGPLEMFHIRTAEFKTALRYARLCSDAAASSQDPVAMTLAHSLMGISLHFAGALGNAREELEAALRARPGSQQTTTIYMGFEGRNLAGAVLGSTLWLQGYPLQAVARARNTVKEATLIDHPLTLALALIWAIYVFLWTGDLEGADEHIGRLTACAGSSSLGPYLAVGRGFGGELAIRRGDARRGIEALQATLQEFHATPYEVQTTPFSISLAQGFAAVGLFSDGVTLIDETIQHVEMNGDHCYLSELLRVKGSLLLSMSGSRRDDAENCFTKSLELSRRQGARGWELRAATDLAGLFAKRGRTDSARTLLKPVLEQFSEGFDTTDLIAAKSLISALG